MTRATSRRGMRFHSLCSKPIKTQPLQPTATAKLVRVPMDLALITLYGPPVCLRKRWLHSSLSAMRTQSATRSGGSIPILSFTGA
jgi:hypothetical protein